MASKDEIYNAIRVSYQNGNTENVKRLAAYLQTMDSEPSQPKKVDSEGAVKKQVLDNAPVAMGITPAMASGFLRGARDVVDTGADYLSRGYDALTGAQENVRVKDMNAKAKEDYTQQYGDNSAASVARVGGNIAATLPATGLLGGVAKLAGATKLGNAIASGGMTTGGQAAGLSAKAADLLTRTAGGAINGGVSAGMVNPDDAVGGAVVGAAMPGAIGALGAGAKIIGNSGAAIRDLVTNKGQQKIALNALARFADNPNMLDQAASQITETGAKPTLAEINKDAGIATLQRSLSQLDPNISARFAERAGENNAARIKVLQDIAQNDAARTQAEFTRAEEAKPFYEQAKNAVYNVDESLKGLLDRPAFKEAMKRAKTLAENSGREFSFTTPAKISGEGATKKGAAKISGQSLQDLKMAMDEMLSDPQSGFSGKAGNVLRDNRAALIDWMEGVNNAFKDGRETYAELTKPLNQMDVGQRLLDKTTSAIRDMGGNQRLQANAFSKALNDEQGLVRKATDFKGVNALADVMTPQQIAALNSIRSELELSANLSNAANGAGSQTAKSLASQNLLRSLGLPDYAANNALTETLMRPFQFAAKSSEPRIREQLAEFLLNPDALKAAKESIAKQKPNALARLIQGSNNPLLYQAAPQMMVNR